MAKLKAPLFSFLAQGRLGEAITFLRRRGVKIAEKKPVPADAKSLAQLSWRHMYQKAVALWHALSSAEKQEWESLARPKHMTGFAWFVSQALKPNPGLYLPLQGGTMQGEIDMAKYRLLRLPLPSDSQEPLTLAFFAASIAPYLYDEGCRCRHTANLSAPHNTVTAQPFGAEDYDTDEMHNVAVGNIAIECKTAGKYLIAASIAWAANNVGLRMIYISHSVDGPIARQRVVPVTGAITNQFLTTAYDLLVGEKLWCYVYQTSGGALNSVTDGHAAPVFLAQRIG